MQELSKDQQTKISRLKSAVQPMFSRENQNVESTLIEIKEKFINSYYILRKREKLGGQSVVLGDRLESFIRQHVWEDIPHAVLEDDEPPSLSDIQLNNRLMR